MDGNIENINAMNVRFSLLHKLLFVNQTLLASHVFMFVHNNLL